MKYLLLILPFFCCMKPIGAQNISKRVYLGIYPGVYIRQATKFAPPYYRELWWYNLNFYPKIGYQFDKHWTLGALGSYNSLNSTLGNAAPIWGGGYFVKYDFKQKDTVRNRKVST